MLDTMLRDMRPLSITVRATSFWIWLWLMGLWSFLSRKRFVL